MCVNTTTTKSSTKNSIHKKDLFDNKQSKCVKNGFF